MTRSALESRYTWYGGGATFIRYLFPAIAILFLVLGLATGNPLRRKAWFRAAAGFAFGSFLVWWQA